MNDVCAITCTALLLLAALPAPASAQNVRSHDTDLREGIGSATTIEIRDVSGSITVTQAADATVTVHAHATSRTSDPSAVTVQLRHDGDSLVICTRYPGSSDCGDHHPDSNNDGNDVNVDIAVTVPLDARVVANTVEGNVSATQLRNDVRAGVVRGNIRIGTSGHANAKTVNGSIDAILSESANVDGVQLETVNGSIHLTVPQSVNASIYARTLSGSLIADPGVTFSQRDNGIVGSSGTITLGRGGGRISLRTLSGSIRVSRA
jgi:hypothetical protein